MSFEIELIAVFRARCDDPRYLRQMFGIFTILIMIPLKFAIEKPLKNDHTYRKKSRKICPNRIIFFQNI